MPDDSEHYLSIEVITETGEKVLSHISAGHTRDGACTAYGHSVAALLKHYKEKREDEAAIARAAAEAATVKDGPTK